MTLAPYSGGFAHADAAGSWRGALRSVPRDAWRRRVARYLSAADVQLDGGCPWDPQIHDDRVFGRIVAQGSLGLGESYVEGWWDFSDYDTTLLSRGFVFQNPHAKSTCGCGTSFSV